MTFINLNDKFKYFQKFKWYLARVEKEIRKKLKCLRSHRGGEFISNEFNEFHSEMVIKRQVFTPSTPQQNGIPGKIHRSIIDCARTLMIEKYFAIKYQKEATNIVVHTLNRVQLKDTYNTPYELWYGYKPIIYYFKLFGSKCYILKELRKGESYVKSDKDIFL